ncbi:MAG: hypothetical protein J5992_09680 [Oscillospiraceae bacterium]|nr:hypothetical protein [Oscillospiraceae bacterium]
MENSRQIVNFYGSNKVLEFNDNLQLNKITEDGGKVSSSLHSGFSKIKVTAVDWSKGKAENAVVASHNLDPAIAKMLMEKIVQGDISFFQTPVGKMTGYSEEKILSKTYENGKNFVSKINISYQPNMSNKWKIVLEEGEAERETTPDGKTIIKKGTYNSLKRVDVYTNDTNMLKAALTVRDYITNWETIAFPQFFKFRAAWEEEQRTQNQQQ